MLEKVAQQEEQISQAESPIGKKQGRRDKVSYLSSEIQKLVPAENSISLKRQFMKKYERKPFLAMTLVNSKNNYVNIGISKTQPQISRMSFPYFLEDDVMPEKHNPKMQQMKVFNRVLTKVKQNQHSIDCNLDKVSNQDPPINEFLCYELSKQINNSLFEVKVLAHQIKKIKQEKQERVEQKDKFKPAKNIRIGKSCKGLPICKLPTQSQSKRGSRWL